MGSDARERRSVMSRVTRYLLIVMIPVVAICVPIIVVSEILRGGGLWHLLYLLWAAVIIIFVLVLLQKGESNGNHIGTVGQ